jgi:hypothetical protein
MFRNVSGYALYPTDGYKRQKDQVRYELLTHNNRDTVYGAQLSPR